MVRVVRDRLHLLRENVIPANPFGLISDRFPVEIPVAVPVIGRENLGGAPTPFLRRSNAVGVSTTEGFRMG